jgi:hypothetical protein
MKKMESMTKEVMISSRPNQTEGRVLQSEGRKVKEDELCPLLGVRERIGCQVKGDNLVRTTDDVRNNVAGSLFHAKNQIANLVSLSTQK